MKRTALFIFLASAGTVFAQQPEIRLNEVSAGYYPNEPSICINKKQPGMVVGAANINYHFVSTDNGKTWENKKIKSSYGVWGDPVLHSDASGHIYLVHLSRTKGKDKDYSFIDRMVIQTSEDGGQTFSDGSYAGLNEPKMQDKPWISTDDFSSKYKGNAYLTWTEFDKINSKKKKHHSRIRFSRSTDKGKSWSDAITISDSVGDAVDDDHTLEGATTAVDVLGNIYCVWAGHNKLYFDKSMDGGKTWGRDRVLFNQLSGWAMDIPHVYRSNGMPFLTIDNSPGEFTGRMYLVWGDTKYGDADVFLSYSDDQGTTWSVPKRVHRDYQGNGKSQYLPNIALDQTTGHLAVVYYDRRNSSSNVFSDVYVSVSENGGESFVDYRFNDKLYNHIGKKMFSGDYIDLDFHNGVLSAIWSGYEEGPNVYNRTIREQDLHALYPIYEVGQMLVYKDQTGRKPVFYIAATTPSTVKVTTYKRKLWFLKEHKEKETKEYFLNHRPGLEGFSEEKVEMTQKKRIKLYMESTDEIQPVEKKISISIW